MNRAQTIALMRGHLQREILRHQAALDNALIQPATRQQRRNVRRLTARIEARRRELETIK